MMPSGLARNRRSSGSVAATVAGATVVAALLAAAGCRGEQRAERLVPLYDGARVLRVPVHATASAPLPGGGMTGPALRRKPSEWATRRYPAPALGVGLRPKPWDLPILMKRLDAQRQAGAPEAVVFDVTTTFGFGCPCPHFAHYDQDGAYGADYFLYPVMAEGVADVARWWLPGVFRIAGWYTGRELTYGQWYFLRHGEPPEREEGRDEAPHPEFVVTGWCYEPKPLAADGSQDYLKETRAEMRKARVPLCARPLRVAPTPVPPWPVVPRDAPCTRETVRLRSKGNVDSLAAWDAAKTRYARRFAGSRETPFQEVWIGVQKGVALTTVAGRVKAVVGERIGTDSGILRFADVERALDAVPRLLCDPDVAFAEIVTVSQ